MRNWLEPPRCAERRRQYGQAAGESCRQPAFPSALVLTRTTCAMSGRLALPPKSGALKPLSDGAIAQGAAHLTKAPGAHAAIVLAGSAPRASPSSAAAAAVAQPGTDENSAEQAAAAVVAAPAELSQQPGSSGRKRKEPEAAAPAAGGAAPASGGRSQRAAASKKQHSYDDWEESEEEDQKPKGEPGENSSWVLTAAAVHRPR